MSWLADNLGTIIVALVLAAVMVAVIVGLVKNRKKGKTPCGCNCAHCAMSETCHSHRK